MLHRILIMALLAPLLMLARPAPASAQFDFGAVFQRAQMIAHQITQISNQVSQIRSMARQLSELEDQLDHMERAARGETRRAASSRSRELAAETRRARPGRTRLGFRLPPVAASEMVDAVRDLGRGGRSLTPLWRSSPERGRPGERSRHPGAVPATSRPKYRHARGGGLPPQPGGRWPAARARLRDARRGGRARRATIQSAQGSFADLSANRNLSNTALQQAGVAAALSQGRINAAVSPGARPSRPSEQANRMPARPSSPASNGSAEWRESRVRANAMAETMRDDVVPEPGRAPRGAPLPDPLVLHGRPALGPGSASPCNSYPRSPSTRTSPPRSRPTSSRTSKASWTSCSTAVVGAAAPDVQTPSGSSSGAGSPPS